MPFGETRPGYPTGSVPTDRRFTGQREESGLGSLYDYNARFYSPALGRFLSADTIVPDGKNPQQFNRYAYTLNNPVRYIDPSGHLSKDQIQDWSEYRTDEQLEKLYREHPDIYRMLFEIHFGDVVFWGLNYEFVGAVSLDNSHLTIGDHSIQDLIDMNGSAPVVPGFEVRRPWGHNSKVVFRSGLFCRSCTSGNGFEVKHWPDDFGSAGWIDDIRLETDRVTGATNTVDQGASIAAGLTVNDLIRGVCYGVTGGACAYVDAVSSVVTAGVKYGVEWALERFPV